jgi:hypothetical protein
VNRQRVRVSAGCGLALAVLGATGCGTPEAPVAAAQQIVTARPVAGWLELNLTGWIDNQAPVAHGPEISWMPFRTVVPDGTRVAVGDVLVQHDTTMIEQWISAQNRELTQLLAEQERRRLELVRVLDEQRRAAADAQAERVVREAKLAADHSDEAAQRHLAELDLAQAQRALERAQRHANDAAALAAAGRIPATDAAKAESERAQAQRRLATASDALAAWDGSGTKALARRQLELAVTRAERELSGLASAAERLAVAQAKGEAELATASGDLQRVVSELATRNAFVADPVLRATAAGTVRLRASDVRAGAKLPAAPCIFVLTDQATVAYVRIPEPLRDLCAVWHANRTHDGRATVQIPAAGATVEARILSIGATAETRPDGSRAFLAVLQLDAEPAVIARLKPGMAVTAALDATTAPRASVPAWAVHTGDDPREPEALLAGGSHRRLRGVRVAGDFIATAGLEPGEQVVALGSDPVTIRQRRSRLSGVLEPVAAIPVKLATGGWIVHQTVPDGARVELGQEIARLDKNASWLDTAQIRFEQQTGFAMADAERRRARLTADQELLDKTKTWRDADLDRSDARLRVLAEGGAEDQRRWEAAEGERVDAAARASEAETLAQASGVAQVRPALSAHELSDLELAARGARRTADRAALNAAAARWPDLLPLLTRAADYLTAAAKAEDARADWHVARLQHSQAYDRAELGRRRRGDELLRNARELEDEVVLAPATGRLFHRNPSPWRPGDQLPNNEPFRIMPDPPPGGAALRRLRLEAPAHRAGTWHTGDHVPVVVPGVGTYTGSVSVVATWYGFSSAGRAEADAGGGSTAVDEQVFNLVIDLALPAEEAERVLPGMTAYVD